MSSIIRRLRTSNHPAASSPATDSAAVAASFNQVVMSRILLSSPCWAKAVSIGPGGVKASAAIGPVNNTIAARKACPVTTFAIRLADAPLCYRSPTSSTPFMVASTLDGAERMTVCLLFHIWTTL
jgi:hypothetical protein